MLVFLLALIGLLTIPFKYVVYVGPGIVVFLGFIVAILIIKIRANRKPPASETAETSSSETGEASSRLQRNWGWKGTAFAIFSAFLIALTVMFGVVLSPPWMPAERLTLNNKQTVTGYVLAQTSDGLTFMQAKSRKITYYNPGVVIGQVFCTNAPATDLPIIYYIKSITRLDLGKYGHC